MLLIVLLAPCLTIAATHYVDINGTNPVPPYTNWWTASTTIQFAVDVALDGDSVLVSSGAYVLSSQVVITNGITVRGFAGASNTVVDGTSTTRCFFIDHSDAVLEGFTITRGRGDWGGGARLFNGATLKDCVVRGNAAIGDGSRDAFGGGVYASNGCAIASCIIESNTATGVKGASYSGTGGKGGGGGVYAVAGCCVTGCTLANNRAKGGKGGDGSLEPVIQYGGWGGHAYGGGIFASGGSTVLCSSITGNTAEGGDDGDGGDPALGMGGGSGGGIYCADGSTVDRCIVDSNKSTFAGESINMETSHGGGVYAAQSHVANCLITRNKTAPVGMFILWGLGGGVCVEGSTVAGCTIASNTGHWGGGVGGNGTGGVHDCIVYGNASEEGEPNHHDFGDGVDYFYCCTTPMPTNGGEGCITNDPQFAGADCRLAASSPCIDTGTNLAAAGIVRDLDGVPRPLDGDDDEQAVFDMGCYEFVHATADTDDDGLSDTNEVHVYGTDATDSDTDGDRQIDGHEVLAGTDPLDDASFLRVDDIRSAASPGGAVVEWPSATGRSYRITVATNAALDFNETLAINVSATPILNSYTDTTAGLEGLRAYRVELE